MNQTFFHEPIVFQVLGLTNNSYWEEAPHLRQCARQFQSVQDELLPVAKRRLASFLHVSVTGAFDDTLLSIAVRIPVWDAQQKNWCFCCSIAHRYAGQVQLLR